MSNFKQSLKQLVGRCVIRLSPRIEEYYYRRNHDDLIMDSYDSRRCIFIHVPKCAGISISQQLYGRIVGHQEAYHINDCYPYSFKRYYTFSVIRDPADRFRSAFNYLKGGGRVASDRQSYRDLLGDFTDAQCLALAMASPEIAECVMRMMHFRTQVEFLEDL